MRNITIVFFCIALGLLFFADIAFTVLDPWFEFKRMIWGIFTPKVSIIFEMRNAIANTLIFALCGLSFGVIGGCILSFFFHFSIVRIICTFIRSIHEIFWAFIFMPIFGLNPLCGIAAIALPSAGILAKGYYEIFQESDLKAFRSLAQKSNKISVFFYTIFPILYPQAKHYTSYRFECALRSSALLGFIGLPTIGFHLESFFRKGFYSEAAALLFFFYLIIGLLKYWYREKYIPFYILAAFLFVSKETSFSFDNLIRFFTYDIVPWPMRRLGFLNETYVLNVNSGDLFLWVKSVLFDEVVPGLINTGILTQIAFVGAGGIALLCIFPVCRHSSSFLLRKISTLFLIVFRTTPEYILAYIFIQLWGPSMVPALFAIALHNGAIVAYLSVHEANAITLPCDASKRIVNRYCFEILPKIYGTILANLFYRWEVMVRESALLGILGIYTIGFYIDNAISEDRIDKALILIVFTALFTIGIDTISQRIRKFISLNQSIAVKR